MRCPKPGEERLDGTQTQGGLTVRRPIMIQRGAAIIDDAEEPGEGALGHEGLDGQVAGGELALPWVAMRYDGCL